MENLTHYPLLLFVAVFVAFWLASVAGSWLRRQNLSAEDEQHEDLGIILGATLTLLALIIGFSVSMASSRYDQRKSLEEAEANAIGTEMLRADLLPPADAANVRKLLGAYLDQRIMYYINRETARQTEIDQRIGQLQADLWAAVRGPVAAEPTPVAALVLAGMNDVINSQGYTQAAFWNRIPRAVWLLMAAIALCSNVLFGYRSREGKAARKLALVLPFVVATAFLLIADIDAPRRGLIHVSPQNLEVGKVARALRLFVWLRIASVVRCPRMGWTGRAPAPNRSENDRGLAASFAPAPPINSLGSSYQDGLAIELRTACAPVRRRPRLIHIKGS